MSSKFKFLIIVLATLVLSGCSLLKKQPRDPRSVASDAFYAEHSRLLGYPLSGNENPDLIREVTSWLGAPYRYGGNTKTGTDCSGMVQQVFLKLFNIGLPRSSSEMADFSRRIWKTNLMVGDLVFFETASRRRINHVGIYLGNNKIIHSTTSQGVIVSDLDEPYWKRTYVRSGRIN